MTESKLRVLAHDVGKYVARTARNLPEGSVPSVLVQMLTRDLYALSGDRRASAVFEELAAGLDLPAIDECRQDFAAIDALEEKVRAADVDAVREAAGHALTIEARLRGLLKGAP